MRLGFDGLDREIDERAARNGASTFYDALKMWIESLCRACARYRVQALALADSARDTGAKQRLLNMAHALAALQTVSPEQKQLWQSRIDE